MTKRITVGELLQILEDANVDTAFIELNIRKNLDEPLHSIDIWSIPGLWSTEREDEK